MSSIEYQQGYADYQLFLLYYFTNEITSFTDLTVKASSLSETAEGTVIIPSFVEFNDKKLCVNTVGESFAANNSRIYNLIIEDSISKIESNAFLNCSEILSVTIKGCKSIGNASFKGCTKITDIQLPISLYSIGDNAFEECVSLNDLTLPEQLTHLGSYAFSQCTSLKSISLLNLDRIQEYTFFGCSSLDVITLSEKLTYIGDFAFSGISVDYFVVPNSVTFVGCCILSNCPNLQKVTIGSGISSLSSNPMLNCPNLKELVFTDSDNPLEITFNGDVMEHFSHRYYSTSSDDYINVYYGGFRDFNIEKLYLGRSVEYPVNTSSGIMTTINTNPFTGNKSIKEVTIGEKVTGLPFVNVNIHYGGVKPVSYSNSFGYFEGCEALESINIYGNLNTISERMFYGTNISHITTPNSIVSIEPDAFSNCHSLNEIYVGKNCKTIGSNAFSNCETLSTLNLYCINPPEYSTGFDNSQYISMALNIPPHTIADYQNAEPWRNFWNLKEDETLETEFNIEPFKYEILNSSTVEFEFS